MGVILLGDKTAAARWLAYAKSRAAALAKQGNNLSQTFSPAEGVTIRVQTLQGTPRVWIEAGGFDYVTSAGPNGQYDQNLWMGALRSGAASVRGKSVFGSGQATNLRPLGDGAFFGGPLPSGSFTGYVQLIATKSSTANGGGFAPWQPAPEVGAAIKSVVYSGLIGDAESGYSKRLHILYQYSADNPGYPASSSVTMPAVASSYDSGQSWNVTQFYVVLRQVNPFNGNTTQAILTPIDIIFLGDNRLSIVCTAAPSHSYLEDGAWNGAGFLQQFQDLQSLQGILALNSSDGGLSWAPSYTPKSAMGFVDWRPPPTISLISENFDGPHSVQYMGGSSIIALTGDFGNSLNPLQTDVFVSTNAGASFAWAARHPTLSGPSFSGLTQLGGDSVGYIRTERHDTTPGVYGKNHVYRTTNGGSTWEKFKMPESSFIVMPGNMVATAVPSLPDPVPEGKVAADYAKLAGFSRGPVTDDTPNPAWKVILSEDGGKTWGSGGIANTNGTNSQPGYNLGVISRKLPAFPIFPDLHKNGLAIP